MKNLLLTDFEGNRIHSPCNSKKVTGVHSLADAAAPPWRSSLGQQWGEKRGGQIEKEKGKSQTVFI